MNKARIAVAALTLPASLLVGLAVHEGYSETAKPPIQGDVPTNGFGSTKGVRLGDKTDPVRALIRLNAEAEEHAKGVRECVKVPLYQHEFDAYVSLAYNIGTGAFCRSTLVKKLNAVDYKGACDEILRWDYSGGKRIRGLTVRRQQEHKQCLGEY